MVAGVVEIDLAVESLDVRVVYRTSVKGMNPTVVLAPAEHGPDVAKGPVRPVGHGIADFRIDYPAVPEWVLLGPSAVEHVVLPALSTDNRCSPDEPVVMLEPGMSRDGLEHCWEIVSLRCRCPRTCGASKMDEKEDARYLGSRQSAHDLHPGTVTVEARSHQGLLWYCNDK